MRFIWVLLLCLLLPAAASAKFVAVLETICGDSVSMPLPERQFVTNILRAEAVKSLPPETGFTIMTRENISAMLPPNVSLEDCEGTCLVETGRNISADYVAQARVGMYGGKYAVTVELYETSSSNLVSSFTGRGSNGEELLIVLEENSKDFFKACLPEDQRNKADSATVPVAVAAVPAAVPADSSASVAAVPAAAPTDSSALAAANSSAPVVPRPSEVAAADTSLNDSSLSSGIKQESKFEKVRVPLLYSSVGMLVVGTVGAFFADYYARDAFNREPDNKYQYRDNKNDIELAQDLRTVGIVMAVLGSVGLGFSIFF